MSPAEKLSARDKLNREYAARSERLNMVHQSIAACESLNRWAIWFKDSFDSSCR